MILKENEVIVKVFRHHGTTLFFRELRVLVASLPFYFLSFLISPLLSFSQGLWLFLAISIVFGIVIAGDAILYYMDRLVITNMRILYVEWQSIFHRNEHEAALNDIQDIKTRETGIISAIKLFDYGHFQIETASSNTTIVFNNAPDPEGIKHFVYHIHSKWNRIHSGIIKPVLNDKTDTGNQGISGTKTEKPIDITAG